MQYNDAEFAEFETVGVEGIADGLLFDSVQVHRCDTIDSPDEFEKRFPVGRWFNIELITTFTQACDFEETSKCGGFSDLIEWWNEIGRSSHSCRNDK